MSSKDTQAVPASEEEKRFLKKLWTIDAEARIVFFENMEDSVGKPLSVCTHFDVITRKVGENEMELGRWFTDTKAVYVVDWSKMAYGKTVSAPRLSQYGPLRKLAAKQGSVLCSFHYEGEELVEHKFFLDVQSTPSANIEETQLLALILTFVVAIAHTMQIESEFLPGLPKKTGGSEPRSRK